MPDLLNVFNMLASTSDAIKKQQAMTKFGQMQPLVNNAIGIGTASTGSKDAWNGGGLYSTTMGGIFNAGGNLASQMNAPYGIGNALQMVSNITDLFGYNPRVSRINNIYSSDSAPTFDLNDESVALRHFMGNFNEDANKKIISSTAQGAMAGTMIAPGVGTAIGAAVGLIGGGLGKLFGGKRAQTAEDRMKNELMNATGRFNNAQQSFYGDQNAMEKYYASQAQSNGMFGMPMIYNYI